MNAETRGGFVRTGLESARFELRAQLGTWSAPLVAFVLVLMVLAYSNSAEYLNEVGAADLPRNAPFVVYIFTATPLFVFMFFLAHVASAPIVRDLRHRMAEVVYAAPAGARAYLAGKWLGALLVGHVVGLAIPLAFLLFPLLARVGLLPAELVGPTPVAHLAHAYVFFVSPLVVILGSFFFGVAALFGRAAAAYAASFGAAIVWMFAYVLLWEGGVDRALAERLDPIGWTSIIAQSTYWTAEEKTSAFMLLSPGVIGNRLTWGTAALITIALGVLRPRVEHLVSIAGGQRKTRKKATAPALADGASVSHTRAWDARAHARVALGAAGALMRQTTRGKLFQAVMAIGTIMGVGSTFVHVLSGPDGRKLPWVGVAWPMAFEHGFIPAAFFMVWSAGQLARRERDHGFEPLMDVLPTRVGRWSSHGSSRSRAWRSASPSYRCWPSSCWG